MKKLSEIIRNKKKKLSKTFMLAKNKLNSIETLISQVLIDLEISHNNLKQLLKKKGITEDLKKILK